MGGFHFAECMKDLPTYLLLQMITLWPAKEPSSKEGYVALMKFRSSLSVCLVDVRAPNDLEEVIRAIAHLARMLSRSMIPPPPASCPFPYRSAPCESFASFVRWLEHVQIEMLSGLQFKEDLHGCRVSHLPSGSNQHFDLALRRANSRRAEDDRLPCARNASSKKVGARKVDSLESTRTCGGLQRMANRIRDGFVAICWQRKLFFPERKMLLLASP